jgi:hypothetical protein
MYYELANSLLLGIPVTRHQALQSFAAVPFFSSPFVYTNQPNALVTNSCYRVVIIVSIRVDRMAGKLEDN